MVRDVDNQKPYLKVFWSGDDVFNFYNFKELKGEMMNDIVNQNNLYNDLLNDKSEDNRDYFHQKKQEIQTSKDKMEEYSKYLEGKLELNQKILDGLSPEEYETRVWLKGYELWVNGIRNVVHRLVIHKSFDAFILLIVCINTAAMCTTGYIQDQPTIDWIESI